ncbi:protein FAR1-RELATED SEQUENCE 6-like [Tasmannia lanceolata]|uniref:protein FAR1-RELATED SEQUENCE 6-like n=1 Tax=Tasmannia lanceolata TaxID=3420 RepID=UPI0040628A25
MERSKAMIVEPCLVEEEMEECSPVIVSMSEGRVAEFEENVDMQARRSMNENILDEDCGTMNLIDEDKSKERDSTTREGDANLVPVIGMEFESAETAQDFYNRYAKCVGFGIKRRSTTCKRRTKELIHVVFSCVKEGYKVKKEDVKFPRAEVREGCMAKMSIKKVTDSRKWVVTQVNTEHTHALSPGEARHYRSPKNIPPIGYKRKMLNSNKGVPVSKAMNVMVVQADGHENLKHGEKEHRNFVNDQRRLSLTEGDAQAMLMHFTRMQAKNPSFFYAMDLDEDGHLRNVLWVDANSKAAYSNFGDVVTFDSTCLTNKYKIPLAPFVGVNHHGQSVLLGCALLSNEMKETYIWLFRTWLVAMAGHPPISIVTDQCKSIQAAVAEVFPTTRHRLCLWHIMKKVPEKLGFLNDNGQFMDMLHNCIYDTLRVEEFEENWMVMINKYNLSENEWLKVLYEERQHWVPVYLKDTFFAGMSTSQRSESINGFFDGFVNSKTTLKEFVDKYDLALKSQQGKECKADYDTWNGKPTLKTNSFFEKQAAAFYTREIFCKFQDEICSMNNCSIRYIKEEGPTITYIVGEPEEHDQKIVVRNYEVTFDESMEKVCCICCSFEFNGILCRHALLVLTNLNIYEIPSHYILTRWRKDAKRTHDLDEDRNPVDESSWMDRYDDLCRRYMQFAEDGAFSAHTYKVALDALREAIHRVRLADDSLGILEDANMIGDNCYHDIGEGSQADNMINISPVLGPNTSTVRGNLAANRFISTREKITTTTTRLRPGHTKPTCKERPFVSEEVNHVNQVSMQESFHQMG